MTVECKTIVTSFRSSGLTQAAYCNQTGISIEKLRYYLYKKGKKKTTPSKTSTAAPEFVSIASPSPVHTYTIIHGEFTIASLVAFLKECNHSC